MRVFATTLVFVSGLAVHAADLAALGYEEYADEATGAHIWLPPGYTVEIKETDKSRIPTRVSPAFTWEEGELAGLRLQVLGVVLMPTEEGKAKQFMDVCEGGYELTNLVPPEEQELTAERLAAFGPEAVEGRVGRYEYDTAEGEPSAGTIYYINAGVYVYAFVLKWPRDNAVAEEAAGFMGDGFSLEEPGETATPPPSPPDAQAPPGGE